MASLVPRGIAMNNPGLAGFLLIGLVAGFSTAHAECVCECVNGQVQPLCENAIDLAPICSPTICPIMSPSIAPIQPPTIPPIGTSSCQEARVCDSDGNCSWQQVFD